MQLFASCYFLLGQESCACAHILFRNVSEFSFIVGSTTYGTTRINLKRLSNHPLASLVENDHINNIVYYCNGIVKN